MTLWNIYRVTPDGALEDIVRQVYSEKKPRTKKGYRAVRGRFTLKELETIQREIEHTKADSHLAYPGAYFNNREGI